MNKLIIHDGDCSIYEAFITSSGNSVSSHVCDCGALRRAIRDYQDEGYGLFNTNDDLFRQWAEHLRAISRSVK